MILIHQSTKSLRNVLSAHRALGFPTQPLVNAAGVEAVLAGQASQHILMLEGVQADGALVVTSHFLLIAVGW